MFIDIEDVRLRKPESKDIEALYRQKNDPEAVLPLGGFGFGYARSGIARWVEAHEARSDEIIWVVASRDQDECMGHVGLYNIDHRIRKAEFAIMLGDARARGRGLGRAITQRVTSYGFEELNLQRVELSVLATNARARAVYEKIGFQEEGCLRRAQFKGGQYLDVVLMARLKEDAL